MPYKDPEVRKAHLREYSSIWYYKNKEKRAAQINLWQKNNPDKFKVIRDRKIAARKLRYRTDPEYRAKVLAYSKEKHRKFRLANPNPPRVYQTVEERRKRCREWAKKHYVGERREYQVAFSKAYRLKNLSRWKLKHKDQFLRRRYGITLEKYNELFALQNGCCAICGLHQSKQQKAMHVDHCHKTSNIRGLLCNLCNWLLGWCKDNPVVIHRAVEYLHSQNKELSDAKTV